MVPEIQTFRRFIASTTPIHLTCLQISQQYGAAVGARLHSALSKCASASEVLGFSTYYSNAIAVGLATHFLLQFHEFKPIEWIVFLALANLGLYSYFSREPDVEALVQLQVLATYLGTLSASISVYRLWFHRCRRFPGPFWARLSKFWAFSKVWQGEYHRTVKQLHAKHGDIVRVGPRELDICNVNAITPIFGAASTCVKGPWYEGTLAGGHVRFLQNETATGHVWKRRIWEAAFNSKALRDYEPRVLYYIDQLIGELRNQSSKGAVDLGLYMSFFTFDTMGDLGFGRSFDMLKHGRQHDYMTIVQGFASANALTCTIPWIATIFAWIPKAKGVVDLFNFATQRVKERLPFGTEPSDIFSKLLVEDKVTRWRYNNTELVLEAFMLTIAGSDTTSSSLATICYYLMAHPPKYAKLRAEIDGHHGPLTHEHLAKLPYLNAVVREALRLLPPIGSGMMHRETPTEGIVVDGVHIPGHTTVGIGALAIQRDPRYYGQPDDFIPERWLGEGPEPFDRNAYMVFSYGPYSCVGKHLAYQELCDVTAAMVRAFEMELAPGYDASSYETSIKDSVISSRVHLPTILKVRKY